MNTINKVAIYVRVSTNAQAEEGYSIDEQVDKLSSYCKIKNWQVYDVYRDGGFTGSNTHRPALERLIKESENKSFDTVLVYKLDRLSRSQKDTLYLIEDVFLANDIDFVSLLENFDTSTPFGKAMIGILSVFAQLEREQIKERMMLGKLGRAKSGKYMAWINPAYGYNYDKKSQKTTVIPSQAIIIKRIFDEFINGKPIAKIASDLNKEGKYGKTTSWKPNSLRSLLKNRIYYGVIEYKGEIYKGEHAPIISKETYDLAQIERAKRREITVKRTNNPRPFQSKYMLSGHLRCGYCGARITLYVSKPRKDGTKLLKYYCVNRKKTCDSGLYLLSDLEDIVMAEIAKFKLDEDYMSRMTKKPKTQIDKEAIENEIAGLDNRLNRLNDLYLNNMIDMDKLKKESSNILATKKTLQSQLETDSEELSAKKQVETLTTLRKLNLQKLSYSDKKSLVDKLISSISVKSDSVKITWNL